MDLLLKLELLELAAGGVKLLGVSCCRCTSCASIDIEHTDDNAMVTSSHEKVMSKYTTDVEKITCWTCCWDCCTRDASSRAASSC